METHSPSLPPLHSGDKKNSPVLLSEQFVAGDEQHRLSLHGGHPHSPNIVFFLCSCRCLALGVFAPVTPLPPDGFVLVRWEGGLCGDFCTAVFLRRGALAGRYGHSTFFWKISVVRYHYKMLICVHSCKDAFILILSPLSLSISSSSLDRCIV